MAKFFSFLCVLLALAAAAQGAMDISGSDFGHIPILHEGRLKPLRRMAEVSQRQICGDACSQQAPENWLATLIFAPETTSGKPMFQVENSTVLQLLQLPSRKRFLYSYEELAVALAPQADALQKLTLRPASTLSRDEKALVRIVQNVALYQQLTHSLTLVAPLAITANDIGLNILGIKGLSNPVSYLQLQKWQKPIMTKARQLAQHDLVKLSEADLAVAYLAKTMDTLSTGGSNNNLLRVLPPAWKTNEEEWITPWQALQGQGGPGITQQLAAWQNMLMAYQANDVNAFHGFAKSWLKDLEHSGISPANTARWRAENIYLRWPWLFAAGLAYAAGLILSLLRQATHLSAVIQKAAGGAELFIFLGLLQHAAVLFLRMVIMQRPPVSNLYESIVFVGFIAALGSVLAMLRPRWRMLLAPALSVSLLLLLIDQFFIGDGDNLSPLIAVLNTKFWLGTHVVCITLGYTACLLTAGYAHAVFIHSVWRKKPLDTKTIKPLLHISLLLVITGTLLGGIWADQSWGRFWGWDPKENGALLIAIWLLWLQHGALTGQLKAAGLTAGTAFLAVIVALSWFGVNLLGVGLHSYGFSSQTAWGLFVFIAAEIVLIAGLIYKQKLFSKA